MKKLFLILLIFISIILLFPWVACYNTTPSLPRGLYILDFEKLHEGSIVRFRLTNQAQFPFIKTNTLLKRVAALQGDSVDISDNGYYVNNVYLGNRLSTDSKGNALPQYTYHGIVPAGMAFVHGDANSFDSRYYGPLPIKRLTTYKKIF